MSQRRFKPAPEHLLVADDEHLMATGLTTSLESLGYAVMGPVGDGEAAIELARAEAPDLALLDIRMPGLDGLSAAKCLWEELNIPSIIISAFSDKRYVEQAQEIGVFGYLLKPVSKENLRVTLAIAWARATSHEAQTRRIVQLEQSLGNRRIIEQAKWKLIQTRGMTEAEAHAELQKTARNNRRRLVDVAEEIITGPPSSSE